MGKRSIGGRMLKHPSGRYAASISADRGPEGNIVAVYIDPASEGSREARIIEHGHRPIYMKAHMLQNAKTSKEGYKYRSLLLRKSPSPPMGALSGGIRALRSAATAGGRKGVLNTVGPMRFNKRLARIWSSHYNSRKNYGDEWKTMSSKRGTSKWIVPAMPAFSPARLLRRDLPQKLRDRVLIP